MVITKEQEVQIPSTPNFIKVGEIMLSIANFKDEELQEIAKEWGKDLVIKARKKRNSK